MAKAAKAGRLEALAAQIRVCTKCPLCQSRTLAVPGDGMADWRYEADPATTTVVEVPGSHVGVVYEPAMYEALARHLARGGAAFALSARAPTSG